MRAVNDNASIDTVAQAKHELLGNLRDAIAGISALTENLEKLRAKIDGRQRLIR